MNHQASKGRQLGGVLLVVGTCIGVAMLGLPVMTGVVGFLPAAAMFGLGCLFMMVTGLLLLEVNLFYEDEVSIISMCRRTLGPLGAATGWLTFLFLFYSLKALLKCLSFSSSLLPESST